MNLKNAKRIVIKIGTSTLTNENDRLNLERIAKISQVLSDLIGRGYEVVLISSGAVSVGLGRLNIAKRPCDVHEKQAVAAVGQCNLMSIYDRCFSEYNQPIAQILLTRDVFDNNTRKELTRGTFNRLIDIGVLPIVNENDAISIDELQYLCDEKLSFGDNDHLSAEVSALIGADALILLTDTNGLYDCNPRENANAKLISTIEKIDDKILNMADAAGSQRGTGGMKSKIMAAKIAVDAGIATAIINGDDPRNIYSILSGNKIGTIFNA